MDCIQIEYVRTDNEGKEWYRVAIVSPTEPASLTFDGSAVDNMPDKTYIAAGSILITPTANYIAFEDGVFTAKGEGGGGGGNVTVTMTLLGNTGYTYKVGATIEEMLESAAVTVETDEYTLTVEAGTYIEFGGALVESFSGGIVLFDEDYLDYLINGDGAFELRLAD